MKKRVLSLVLCFVLCLSLCPTAAFADGEDGHIHEQEEQAPLVVSATMAPETTETPVEPEAEPTPEPTAAPVAEPEAPVVDEAVAAVQARIDALPAVDSVTAEDYDAVQNAYDAYDALTAEQQALITGAEAFEALFNWFNNQVAVLAEEHEHSYDSNGFCTVADYCYQPATMVSDDNYQISNAGQLYWFASKSGLSKNTGWNAKLTADITVNSGTFDANGNYTEGDAAATPRELVKFGQNNDYKGTFDGDGHTISGLYDYADGKTGNVGLFSANGATIQNLTIDNMYISAPQSTVGLIVGSDCSVTVKNVTVQNSYIISRDSNQVGAIVAWLKGGSVSNCRSINNVVQGQKNNVGAIVGWNNGGVVENCYSTSTVKVGNDPVSKVVGNGTAKNCYYLAEKETESQNGVAGKTAAQFKSGEVAYLLNGSKDNGTWKQTIGTDAFPNFTGGAVYETSPCPSYTNNASNLYKEHDKVKGTCTVCGDGCKHEKWTDGVCDDCGETAVAKMTKGDTTGYFMDLGEALLAAAADNNCTVTVLENVSSDVTVDLSRYSANITLDLNGKTVTKLSYEQGYEYCPLTVKDSGSGGTLGDLTLKHSTVTLTGGTVTALNMTGRNASISGGTVTTLVAKDSAKVGVSGGTVTTLNMTGGTVTLSGGTVNTVTLQGSADGWNKGTLNMTGGNVTTITSGTNAAVNVSNGTVTTLNMTDGEASLTGGSYERITGAETITLGDLLPAGKVFAKGSDIKPDSTKLTSDGIALTGYSITDCTHSSGVDAVGCCVNCGADREVIIVRANDTETKYATAAEAFAAAKGYTSATVTLRKDVHASETITLEKGAITLDLGGHTLSGGGQKVLDLTGSAALTVNAASGGTIRNTYTGWNAPIAVSGEARLTLASAQVTNDTDGDLTLSGGETTITAGANIQVNVSISNGKLTVTGGTMEKLTASGGEVSLSGGTFNEIKASGSVASCYALLAEGYAFAQKSDAETLVNGAVAKLTNVTVVPHSAHDYSAETGMCACGLVRVAQIGDVYYTSLTDALTAVGEGQTIKLLANVTAPADGENSKLDLSAKSNVTIDLNGKTLSGAGDLTITGNVTITDTGTAAPGAVTAASGKSVIIAGDVTVAGNATFPGNVMVPTGGKLTVSGGTFGTMSDTTGSGTVTIAGGSATITGGTFHIVATTGGSLTISGGAFGSWPNEEGGEPIGGVFPNGGTVTMTAGAIGGQLLAENASNVTISGGTIKVLNLGGTGSHTISGGTVTGETTISCQQNSAGRYGSTTIRGGSFQKLTINSTVATVLTLRGGSFTQIKAQHATPDLINDCLAHGEGECYVYVATDGATKDKILTSDNITPDGSSFTLIPGTDYTKIEVRPHTCTPNETTGLCECGRRYVAYIGSGSSAKYYPTFADVVKAAQTGDTISLLTDVANTESAVTFPAGSYTIDLNGKRLYEDFTLAPNAVVTVKDGTEDTTKSARKVDSTRPKVEAPITVQGITENNTTAMGKLTLNGVDAADVTLLNQGGGALEASDMLALENDASIDKLYVKGDGAGIQLKNLALADTAVTVGESTVGSRLELGADATVKSIEVNPSSTFDITGGTATTVNVTPGGIIKMTAGKVTTMNIAAIPQEGTTAKLENFTISGGEIDTLTLGAADVTTYTDIKKGLTGGSYGKIEILGGTLPAVRELLAAGYAFKNSSGFVLWGDAQGASIENVNVAKCVHQNTAPGNECKYCGQPLVAQLVAADGKTSFYTSFAEAYAAASTTGESVITLLANGGKAGTSLSVDKAFRLLLGTYELKDKLVIAANGSLEVGNGSGTMAAIEQTGGTLSVETAATIQSLTVSGGTTKLQAGTYTSITTSNGITADDLLDNGYAYYKTAADGSKTWLTVTNETALQNVSVGRIPLLDITLTASPASLTYGDDLTLTASSVDGADYEWYEVDGETETKIEGVTGASYEDTKPNAGSHAYRCKVTKDGYTVTLDKTVTVAKADIPSDDIHAPEAISGLTYNGGEQMLISAGAFGEGITGCTIKYKLGADGTYGTDASALKGTDADDYTIYYYVDGGTNYNDIGSADAPREIKVTIAPRDLVASVAVPEYFVSISSDDLAYSGQPQAPTFTLTLNHRNEISATETRVDTLETLVQGADYTQSVTKKTDIGTYTAGFTGKGNYTGTATVDWNIVKAPAPTATDGSLTVYNQIAYTYTVDLASLLPVLPAGCEYGTLTYALKAVGEGDDDSKITVEGYLDGRTLTNGTLTLPVPFVDSTDTGAIAALRVTVEAENYETFTLTLNVSRANRVSPIGVGAPLEGLTKDNVTGDDREALEDLLDDLDGYLAQNPGEGEKKELEDFKKEAEELIERLDDAKAAMENDAIGAADDIDASNAEPGHKGRLRSAKRAIQDALDTYGPNYTAAEKAALNEKLARINAALAAIEKLEENAKNDQTDKPVKTGDEAMPILWIVLIVVAAGCVVVLLAARRKKK